MGTESRTSRPFSRIQSCPSSRTIVTSVPEQGLLSSCKKDVQHARALTRLRQPASQAFSAAQDELSSRDHFLDRSGATGCLRADLLD